MKTSLIIGAVAVLICIEPAFARKISDEERLRQQAEHLCYDDVQKLCAADIPDETKITACMKLKRASLSPACGKVFDRGI